MFLYLLLLLILAPICELVLLIWLAQATSWLATAVIVLATGFIGAALARWQGLRAWNAIRADMAAGRAPAGSVTESVLILIAGVVLLTPGLISDTIGFLLLIPSFRRWFGRWILAWLRERVRVRVQSAARARGVQVPDIIDAEFRRADAPGIDAASDRNSNGQALRGGDGERG